MVSGNAFYGNASLDDKEQYESKIRVKFFVGDEIRQPRSIQSLSDLFGFVSHTRSGSLPSFICVLKTRFPSEYVNILNKLSEEMGDPLGFEQKAEGDDVKTNGDRRKKQQQKKVIKKSDESDANIFKGQPPEPDANIFRRN